MSERVAFLLLIHLRKQIGGMTEYVHGKRPGQGTHYQQKHGYSGTSIRVMVRAISGISKSQHLEASCRKSRFAHIQKSAQSHERVRSQSGVVQVQPPTASIDTAERNFNVEIDGSGPSREKVLGRRWKEVGNHL